MELQHGVQHVIKTSYTEESTKVKKSLQTFRICCFCDFLEVENFNFGFSSKVGVAQPSKEKYEAPL